MENLFMRNFELDGIGSFSRVVLIMNAGNPVVGLQWRSQRQSHFFRRWKSFIYASHLHN